MDWHDGDEQGVEERGMWDPTRIDRTLEHLLEGRCPRNETDARRMVDVEQTMLSPFQQALEVVEQLPAEDQKALVEIVRQRLIEERREEIARNARATLDAFREGRTRNGTMDDLRRDLLDES